MCALMSEILRLHTDAEGKVWCGYKDVCSHPTNLSVSEFVNTSMFKSAKRTRCLGTAQNAKLVIEAHQANKKREAQGKPFSTLEVGSPQICPVRALREDPVYCLMRMWQPDSQSRLLHHWHPVDSFIFNSYLLVDSIRVSSDKALTVFKHHPAFSSVSFVGTSNPALALHLIVKIVDPRWFWNADKPHRLSKLNRYLDLTPSSFKTICTDLSKYLYLDDLKPGGSDIDSSHLVALAWASKEVEMIDYSLPENFLWRIYRDSGFNWQGLLKASKSFIQFVVYNWLDNVSFRKNMFDPEIFFKTQNEILAYKDHIEKSRIQG